MKGFIILFSLVTFALSNSSVRIQFYLFCDDYCSEFYSDEVLQPGVGSTNGGCRFNNFKTFSAELGKKIRIVVWDAGKAIYGLGGYANVDGFKILSEKQKFWTPFPGASLRSYGPSSPYNFWYAEENVERKHNVHFTLPSNLSEFEDSSFSYETQFQTSNKTFYTSSRRKIEINLLDNGLIQGIKGRLYDGIPCPYNVKIEFDSDFQGQLFTEDGKEISSEDEVASSQKIIYVPNKDALEEYQVSFRFYVYKFGYKKDSDDGTVIIDVCSLNCLCKCTNGKLENQNFCEINGVEVAPYYHTEEDKCVPEKPRQFYLDEVTGVLERCHENCEECYKKKDDTGEHCTECITDRFFIETEKGKCILESEKPGGFFMDENKVFRQCYNTCSECSKGGEENTHNCDICKEGLEYSTGDSKGNCLDISLIEPRTEEILQFLPIKKQLSNSLDVKSLQIKDDYKIYYYTTDTNLKENTIPYVKLEKCEEELREEYNIEENEEIFIGEILKDNKTSNITFQVYDRKGQKELDITKCTNSIKKIYPINKDFSEKNLISSIFSDRKLINEKFEIYDPESSFYLDPCDYLVVSEKEVDLFERQEMFKNEIQFCPEDCTISSHSFRAKTVSCDCQPNFYDKESVLPNYSFTYLKNKDGFNLLSCKSLLSHFPSGKSSLHWVYVGTLAINILAFTLLFHELPKFAAVPHPGPGSKRSSRASSTSQSSDNTEKWLEMKKIETRKKKSNLLSSKDLENQEGPSKKYSYEYENSSADSINSTEVPEKKKEEEKGFCENLKCMFVDKVLIGSIFFNSKVSFSIHLRIILNLTTISFIIFANSIFYKCPTMETYKNTELQYEASIFAALISFALYKVGYAILANLCLSTKASIIIKSVFELIITTAIIGFCWYYMFLFGFAYDYYQKSILILSSLSLLYIIGVQFILGLILSGLATCAMKKKSKPFLTFCNILDIIF